MKFPHTDVEGNMLPGGFPRCDTLLRGKLGNYFPLENLLFQGLHNDLLCYFKRVLFHENVFVSYK